MHVTCCVLRHLVVSAMHRVEINKVYTRGHPVDGKDDGGVTEENHMLHVCIMYHDVAYTVDFEIF